MRVEHIELQEFRVYARAEVTFSPGVNILVGPNAAGKTTVLEALSLLATGRSFRGATDGDLARDGGPGYRVAGRYTTALSSHTVEVRYTAAAPPLGAVKVAAVDGQRLGRPGELLGRLPLVSFSPDDLSLVKGGPAERRRFLDVFLAQTHPLYRDTLSRYQRTLAQRNALLGDLGARRLSTAAAAMQLEPWDEALAAEAAVVQRHRDEAAGRLAGPAARAFHGLDPAPLALHYQPDPFDPGHLPDELKRGLTLSGPHRDELLLTIGGQDARRFASQGQQRSVVLALKLSARQGIEDESGEAPVLLLDDVMSELDPGRRAALLPLLGRCQAVVTATDRVGLQRTLSEGGLPTSTPAAAWFGVAGGNIVPEGEAGAS